MTELLLTPDMIVTPGYRVIVREVESRRAREAYARAERNRLKACQAAISGGLAVRG